MHKTSRIAALGIGSAVVVVVAGATALRLLSGAAENNRSQQALAIPVEVSEVVVGPISEHKAFSATLEASAEVTIASKIQGRVRRLSPDIGDSIERGQLIAELESDEFLQDVLQAKAELAVAEAQLVEAKNAVSIAERELTRIQTLHERGIASDAALDTATTQKLTGDASVKVAEAQVERAGALVEAAQIRLGYTSIRAHWEGQDNSRVVSERYAEEGDTLSANDAVISIVELNPIDAVIFVTERDYPSLVPGLEVSLTADAFPDRTWAGSVSRVSPVFREGSRQARVEIRLSNEDLALKPGMFARVDTVLRTAESSAVVPAAALTKRNNDDVVFILDKETMTVTLLPVTIGIRDGESVQIIGDKLTDESVVTLGQHLLDDGVLVSLPDHADSDKVDNR